MSKVDEQIKAGMRRFLAEAGQKVSEQRDIYAWNDQKAYQHIADGCAWQVPEGVVVKEVSFYTFAGTFTGCDTEIGLNAEGCRCACGRYKGVTLRVDCSLDTAIRTILGYEATTRMEL